MPRLDSLVPVFFLAIGWTAQPLGAAPSQTSGPTVRWEVDDRGAGWTGRSIAIGDHGSALIGAAVLSSTQLAIHSTASSDPISVFDIPDAPQCRVAAAREGQSLAAISSREAGLGGWLDIIPELRVWDTARPGAPDWTYTFPMTRLHAPESMDVHIADDGQRVVAWYSDLNKDIVYLRVFDASGQLQLSVDLTDPLGAGGLATDGSLSADGSRLLLELWGVPQLIDLASGQILHGWAPRAKRGGLALSADGQAVAIGDLNQVSVYHEDQAGSFPLARTFALQGNRYGGTLALDRDGSHLAFAVQWTNHDDRAQIRCHEIQSGVQIWRQELEVPGNSKSLTISQIQVADDAASVAASSWGDDSALSPTGFVFAEDGAIACLFRTEGSALDMDYDPAAELIALATKDTHVVGFGNGGDLICADTRIPELRISGRPTVGTVMQFEVAGPGTHARLAITSRLGEDRTPFGQSQLDLSTSLFHSGWIPLTSGRASQRSPLPPAASVAGAPLHLQAILIDATTGLGLVSNRVSIRVLP